jgi:hypothetical protein
MVSIDFMQEIENYIKQNLIYDYITGLLYKRSAGSELVLIGFDDIKGYKKVSILEKDIMIHRVAWFLFYREWPTNQIDHINRIKFDNRICNLREATSSENNINKPNQSNNTSGYKGVMYEKSSGKWIAYIGYNNKTIKIGRFINIEDAIKARLDKEKEFYGEFSV